MMRRAWVDRRDDVVVVGGAWWCWISFFVSAMACPPYLHSTLDRPVLILTTEVLASTEFVTRLRAEIAW